METFEDWWDSDKRRYYYDWEESNNDWRKALANAAWDAAKEGINEPS